MKERVLATVFLFVTQFDCVGGGGTTCGSDRPGGEGVACVSTLDCCYDSDAASVDVTDVLTCSRFARACRPAAALPLGETCLADAQCASRTCDTTRWGCTAVCQSDAACTGGATVCSRRDLGPWMCRPVCASDADCVVYARRGAPRLTCKPATTRGGLTTKTCDP